MEQAWPELPEQCPPDVAQPWPGAFYRLVNDSGNDWRNHVQIHGPEWVADHATGDAVNLCRFNALSIFDTPDAARSKLTYRKFDGHRVVRFEMTDTMGVVQQTGRHHHYSWWPHGATLQPPPPTVDVS